MTAQEICTQIDSLFGTMERSEAATLQDMRMIASRAGLFAALGEEGEECWDEEWDEEWDDVFYDDYDDDDDDWDE